MRRIIRQPHTKPIKISADESLYNKMEQLRKDFKKRTGENLPQREATRIIANNIKPIKFTAITFKGGLNVRKKKR